MNTSPALTRIASALLLSAVCAPALALNGFFAHGYGTQSKAMGGAGVALALDALAPATNPAAIVRLGRRTDAGLALFHPVRGYTASGTPSGACASAGECSFGLDPQSIDSGSELFPVPSFGLVRPISERAALGIAVFGNGGLNTDYTAGSATFGVPSGSVPPGQSASAPGVYGAGDAGIDLSQLFVVASYARRLGDRWAIGIAPILAGQRFRAKGLASFAAYSSDPAHLGNTGYDTALGGGGRVGIQAEVHPQLQLGASWQSRIYMAKFDRYAGLFAGRGDLDIPSTFTLGAAAIVTPALTVAVDVQHILYGDVDAIANPLLPNLAAARLGDDGGAGFGWKDMTIIKLGVAVAGAGQRTWRFGYSYGTAQIPGSQNFLNVLGPAVVQHHLTAGLTQTLAGGRSINLSLMFAPYDSIAGPNPLDPAQRVEVEARMLEVEISYAWGS